MAEIKEFASEKAIKQFEQWIEMLKTGNTEMGKMATSFDKLSKATKKSEKSQKDLDTVTNEGNRLLKQRETLTAKQDKSLKKITLDVIKQQEALKEQNKQLREQARADLGLKKRSSLFSSLTKSILAAGAGLIGINTALQLGKKLAELFFSGTQNSADRLRIRIAGLKAQFDALKDSIAILGDSGGDALDNVESKTSQVVRGLILFAKVKLFGSQKALELEAIGMAAEDLEKRLILVERAAADLNLINAKRLRDAKEFNKISEDTSQQVMTRYKASQKAFEIEEQIYQSNQDIAREKIAILLNEKEITDEQIQQIVNNGLQLKDVGLTLSKESDRQHVIEQITEYYNKQTESLERQTTIQNKLNILLQQARKENELNVEINTKGLKDSLTKNPEKLTVKVKEITQEMIDTANETMDNSPVSFWDKFLAIDEETKQQFVDQFADLGNTLFDLGQAQRERELEGVRSNYAAKIAAAEGNTELQERLARELATREAQIQREQAQSEKNQALFNVLINTAVGITKTGATVGFPAAIPLIAIQTALGALQAGIIAAQPLPEIPAFFKGTSDTPSIFTAGEKGSELMFKKDGSVELTPNKTTLYSGKEYEHASIIPSAETQRILAYNQQKGQNKDLLNELKLTRKAIEKNNVNISFSRNVPRLNMKHISRKYGIKG